MLNAKRVNPKKPWSPRQKIAIGFRMLNNAKTDLDQMKAARLRAEGFQALNEQKTKKSRTV